MSTSIPGRSSELPNPTSSEPSRRNPQKEQSTSTATRISSQSTKTSPRPSIVNSYESRHCFEAEADFRRTDAERTAKISALVENDRLRKNFRIVAVWAVAMTALSAYLIIQLIGL